MKVCIVIFTVFSAFTLKAHASGSFDHHLWNRILQEHVKGDLVNYQEVKGNPKTLYKYLKEIAAFSKEELLQLSSSEQIAFYLNAYNALTVKRIINHYPPKRGMFNYNNPKVSIRNISGVWDKLKDKVAGELLTLNEIEHKILRKKFKEPRIHMALVCASLGCPPLQNSAFTGEKLNGQLDHVSRLFLLDKTRNRFCVDCNKIYISKIFEWYGGDFENTYPPNTQLKKYQGEKIGSVITFAASFFPEKTKKFLLRGNYKVNFLDYNWKLNELND